MSVSSSSPGTEPAAGGRRRRGFVLLTAAGMVLLVVLPAMGLAIDAGMMYLVQLRLSAASDAAALAGARALARGADDAAQRANAESTADAYFHANFPAGYFNSSNAQVTNVAAIDSTYMRSITTTSSVDVPFLFMRALRLEGTTLRASAKSTRRDVNVMIVMDRSTSLVNSSSCTPLKAAAVNFVQKFAETRDNLGLITFATSSKVDVAPVRAFKTPVTNTLNSVICSGATNSAQALWQSYVELAGLGQNGALNVIVFFTDGRPTAVTADFPVKGTCNNRNPLRGVLTPGYSNGNPTSLLGLYKWVATAQPMSSDQSQISIPNGCENPTKDSVSYAPLVDIWSNSLSTTAYKTVQTYSSGLSIAQPQNVENFSANAADSAALRVRRGDPDPLHSNRRLEGVMVYCIGLGDVDATLLKRMANDPSLASNPVAAGNQGRYIYAANATELDLAFTRVASEMLRLAH